MAAEVTAHDALIWWGFGTMFGCGFILGFVARDIWLDGPSW